MPETAKEQAVPFVRPVFVRAPDPDADEGSVTVPVDEFGFATDFAPGMAVACRFRPDNGDHHDVLGFYIERRGDVQWVAIPFEAGNVWQVLTTFDQYPDVTVFNRPVCGATLAMIAVGEQDGAE